MSAQISDRRYSMKLHEMINGLECKEVIGSLQKEITGIYCDSKITTSQSVFVCIDGTSFDSHQLIGQMILKDVAAIVVSKKDIGYIPDTVTVIRVENSRHALAIMAANYYDNPSKKMKMIGITGTKGKTTTAYMIREILELAGVKTCLIGTIETIIGEHHVPSENTTPDALLIQQTLSEAVDAGCKCAVMEVSSQGLKLNRVDGIIFDYAVFLNLSQDHIGGKEHKDFEEYFLCKKKLFHQCKIGIFNLDDPYALEMMKGNSCIKETFAINSPARHQVVEARLTNQNGILGSTFDVIGWYDFHVTLNIPGRFNWYNALAAIAVVSHFGIKTDVIRFALAGFKVKGRVEMIPLDTDYTLMIDYAHNAVSLQNVLMTLKEYHPNRLICMFGCGGNRSRTRRFEMGKVASVYADFIVVTNDNPRDEEPANIIGDILIGIGPDYKEYVVIPERIEAIRFCMKHALPNDFVVLAGKGHETYQEIKGVKYPCDERELIRQVCKEEGIRQIDFFR